MSQTGTCTHGHKVGDVCDRQIDAQLYGAGDGTRTRDNLLGRQGLYQLSYSRKIVLILT